MPDCSNILKSFTCLRKLPVLAMIVWLFLSHAAAQVDSEPLSLDNEEFYAQISAILLNTPSERNKKEAEKTLERFFPTWGVDRFTREDRDEVRKLIETMRARKMKAFPYLHDYIYALTLIGESQLSSDAIMRSGDFTLIESAICWDILSI